MTDFEDNIIPRYVAGPSEVTTTMTFTTHPQVAIQFPDREDPVIVSCASDEVMRLLRERGGQIVGIERPEAAKARLKAEVEEVRKAVAREWSDAPFHLLSAEEWVARANDPAEWWGRQG